MTFEDLIKTATHIEVEAAARYWEDAEVNGVEDTDGTLIFGRKGDCWCVRINLAEGRIEGWPEDMSASIHYKVCDAGRYWLQDADGRRIARSKGYYVPDEFLCHGGFGYGDYIIMKVAPGGNIEGYVRALIDDDRWLPYQAE